MRHALRMALILVLTCASYLVYGQPTMAEDEFACATVASRTGRPDFAALSIELPEIDEASGKEVIEALGGKRYGEPDPETTYLWHLDLDGDGLEDRFAIDYGNGTMHLGRGYFLSGAPQSTRRDFDAYWDDGGALDLNLLKIAQHFYVLSSTGTSSARGDEIKLDRLWRLAGDGEFHAVCGFSSAELPMEITEGADAPLCKDIADGRAAKPEYNLAHNITNLQTVDDLFWSKYPTEGIALADIDNDGSVENIMRVRFSSSAGRGCSAQYLVVTDESRSSVQKTPINEFLLNSLGGFPCGPDLDLLSEDNVIYVDAKGTYDRNIFRLRGLAAEKVCSYRGGRRFTYQMFDPQIRCSTTLDRCGEN
jgi:hypothetical protein